MFPEQRWYLYDNISGFTILKHPYKRGRRIPCPHCGRLLKFDQHSASCCNEIFKVGFGEIRRKRPVGIHARVTGRGWDSLRPYDVKPHNDVSASLFDT